MKWKKNIYLYRERDFERDRRSKGEIKERKKRGGRVREEEGREKEKLTRRNVLPSE